jgi:hypothetical protein
MLNGETPKTCAICPHAGDCATARSCLDDVNMKYLVDSRQQFPRLMTPVQANRCAALLRKGWTLRRLYNGGGEGTPIVSPSKLQNHCAAYPVWGDEALRLARANAKAADALKGRSWHERTKETCLKGLHPMTGDNLRIDPSRGRRACLACRNFARDNPPRMTADALTRVKRALHAGATKSQICNGKPLGGGKIDKSLILTTNHKFYQQRRLDPEFNKFVLAHIVDSNSRGQKLRQARARTLIHTTAAREEANDFRRILALLPVYILGRDDIAQDIFLAVFDGTLKRDDIQHRVKWHISDHNKRFPTNFAKFGNSPLVSLDEVMFDDGTTTRGDTVSRGLWD